MLAQLPCLPSSPGIDVPEVVSQMTVGNVIAGVAFLLGVAAILISSRKMLKPFTDSIKNFMSDWNGEPARPGVERRLGVMEQLADFSSRLASVEHEFKPNNGSSMRDKINEITDSVTGDKNDSGRVSGIQE